jgi:cytochrome b561
MVRNTKTLWGWPAKLLHWIGATAILILLVHGGWMTHLRPRPDRLANYAWHSALGYDVLALMVLRRYGGGLIRCRHNRRIPSPGKRLAARLGFASTLMARAPSAKTFFTSTRTGVNRTFQYWRVVAIRWAAAGSNGPRV